MRPLLMTVLILSLPVATNLANDDGVPLPFVPPDQREANTSPAKGPAGQDAIEVTSGGKASTTNVAILESPPISTDRYLVRGRVKCEQVAGDGYLELWNDFGPK